MQIIKSIYKNNLFLIILWIISIFVFVGTIFLHDTVGYSSIKRIAYENINYNNHSNDLKLSAFKEFSELDKSDYKEINISFYAKVESISGWNNIFQTAPLNSGIRMELSEPSALGLVIKSKNKEALRGFYLTRELQLGKWHFVDVKIDINKHLIVLLDNKIVVDLIDPNIDYDISEIAVGSGFSKSRPFNGELSNFGINYTLLKKYSLILSLLMGLKIISILIIVMIPYALLNFKLLDRENKIKLISSFILIGFVFSVGHYVLLSYRGFHNNVYDFMLSPNDIFKDFTNLNLYIRDNNPYTLNVSHVSQFPLLFRLASFFNMLPEKLSIILFMSLFVVFFLYYCFRNIITLDKMANIKNVLIFSLFSYPIMFALSRGNYETIVFIFVALFVYFYENGKASISIIFLSLAITIKPFPAFLLILLFSDKKYKEAAYTILLAVLITIGSYASFNGGIIINLKSHLATLQMYNNEYAIGNGGLGYGNSLFGATKIFIAYFYPESFHIVVNKLFRIYTLLTVILFGLISIYIIIVEKEYWKKVALLVFCMNIFPHVSADYKLIHLFIPLFLYINTKKTDNNDLLYISIFSLLVISKSYYYFHFDPSAAVIPYATNSAAILNPVIMITGVIIIMTSGIKKLWYSNLNVKTESM